MNNFQGFPANTRFTRIPDEFFTQLLPQINCQNTLKVVLYSFWRLERSEFNVFFMLQDDFVADTTFMEGLGETESSRKKNLENALEKAVDTGVFLVVTASIRSKKHQVYFINTPKGKLAAEGLQVGEWNPADRGIEHIELMQKPSNAFKLYEENIGPLTPMIAEMIKADEAEYPAQWLEDSIKVAVKNNKRSWSYIQAILKRWQVEGR